MEGRNFEEIFQKYDFWEKLTQEQKQFLKERVKWNQYQEGQFVTGTGSDCLGMFLVQRGTMRVYLLSEEGKEATVFRIHEGELCMMSGSCLLSSIPFDFWCIRPTGRFPGQPRMSASHGGSPPGDG